MSAPLVETTEEFLAISALRTRSSAEILDEFCRRAIAGGVPIARAYLGWRLLHPLFMSHNLIFEASTGVSVERFRHTEGERSEAYQRSPLKHVLENDLSVFRRRLVDPDCPRDFPVLDEFAGRGYTDYVIFLVDFGAEVTDAPGSGVIMTFASHGPDGFTPEHMALLERLKFMLALSTRIEIETEMRQTLARTYLGRSAAEKVLSGQIRRGEGRAIEAVVWYCDLRGSTHLCEAMGVDAYLPLLNDYFSVTAGPVTDRGGEVLDFIGDAVLAIFSLDAGGLDAAMEATSAVVEALESFRQRHSDALGGRDTVADVAGIAIDIGTVIYGNIGAPDRLTFSVIGPTVNKVARIERLTKTLHEPVLVTAPVAAACRGSFSTLGMFELDGVSAMEELFALDAACTAPRAALAEAVEPALASR